MRLMRRLNHKLAVLQHGDKAAPDAKETTSRIKRSLQAFGESLSGARFPRQNTEIGAQLSKMTAIKELVKGKPQSVKERVCHHGPNHGQRQRKERDLPI